MEHNDYVVYTGFLVLDSFLYSYQNLETLALAELFVLHE